MPADLSRLVELLQKYEGDLMLYAQATIAAQMNARRVSVDASKQVLLAAIAEICEERDRLRSVVPPTWTCGCGWINGVGLAHCSMCTRTPAEGNGVIR